MFLKWGVFQVGWKCLIAKATQTIIASSVNRTTSQTQREQVCFTSQTRSAERRSPVRGVQLWECPGVAVVQSLPAVPCLPRSHLEGASNPASIRQATGPFCCGWSGRGEEENMVKIMRRWTWSVPTVKPQPKQMWFHWGSRVCVRGCISTKDGGTWERNTMLVYIINLLCGGQCGVIFATYVFLPQLKC